ncbi:monovalent cation/H(+) antiporter subunit G [Natrialbaceae archaeon A-CW3]
MIETLYVGAIVVLLALGVFFTFVSAVGVLRLPDVYARAHTASQTDTLGAGLALAAVALALGWQHATVYTVLLLFFVFITNPTAAHAIARSAAEMGIEPWTADDEEANERLETDGGVDESDVRDGAPSQDATGGENR